MSQLKFTLLAIVTLLVTTDAFAPIQPGIANGHDAVRGQFPFYAFLTMGRDGETVCGGSLISSLVTEKSWVLTAAHCLENATHIKLQLGFVNMSRLEGGQVFSISSGQVFIHPNK